MTLGVPVPMRKQRTMALLLGAVVFAGSLLGGSARAQTPRPALLRDVGIEQKLNAQVPLDLQFRDETGRAVRLAEYFGERPVILSLVYYDCPMLCTQVLNGMARGLQNVSLEPAKDFNIVSVSIDPKETPGIASGKKRIYAGLYGRPSADHGWRFLTGDESNIKALAQAVGFRYAYDPESGQYAHAAVILVLTPQGRISRYFYGIQYPSRDLRLGLVEASSGKVGSVVDQILLFCYHYDPTVGKYGIAILNIMRVAGILTVLGVALMIYLLSRRQPVARKASVA